MAKARTLTFRKILLRLDSAHDALEIRVNLAGRKKVSHIIQGLSMHINRHDAVSVLGLNGVEKTTTLRTILGLTPERSGRILLVCVAEWLTLLLVEQNYRMALKVASRHYLMGLKGLINGTATSEELLADRNIIKQHLSV
ncbi:MAG: hypothetical protein LJE96_09980 [Deltaproteobacteria bacterium]|nr:hypothetical protein [Deltaproteobacteria bacterium]